jgi:hypothetical protein
MNHRPANLRPPLRKILIHHDHIDRPANPSNRIAQADRLGNAVLDVTLDNQEVQIAIACELATRCRSEQNYAGGRPSGISEALPSQIDQLLRGHNHDSLPAYAASIISRMRNQDSEIELQAVRPHVCFDVVDPLDAQPLSTRKLAYAGPYLRLSSSWINRSQCSRRSSDRSP